LSFFSFLLKQCKIELNIFKQINPQDSTPLVRCEMQVAVALAFLSGLIQVCLHFPT
jgi:hypothetical protein